MSNPTDEALKCLEKLVTAFHDDDEEAVDELLDEFEIAVEDVTLSASIIEEKL